MLVVDGNAADRKILHYQLEGWRMRHDSAADAPEAFAMPHREVAAGDPYTLIILDVQMPGMDGLQLAQAIKADPAIASARLLMMTSLGHRSDARLIEEAGIMACLTEPVKQSQLFDHSAMSSATVRMRPTAPMPRMQKSHRRGRARPAPPCRRRP